MIRSMCDGEPRSGLDKTILNAEKKKLENHAVVAVSGVETEDIKLLLGDDSCREGGRIDSYIPQAAAYIEMIRRRQSPS